MGGIRRINETKIIFPWWVESVKVVICKMSDDWTFSSQTDKQADGHNQIDFKWPEKYISQTYCGSSVDPSVMIMLKIIVNWRFGHDMTKKWLKFLYIWDIKNANVYFLWGTKVSSQSATLFKIHPTSTPNQNHIFG